MEIILGRLANGSFVIGKHNSKGTSLENAHMVLLLQSTTDPTQVQAQIVPFMHPLSREKVNLKIHELITYVQAPDNLAASYQQITGGIVIPPTRILKPARAN